MALARRYVIESASICGEFSVTKEWVRGAISNFWSTFNPFRTITQASDRILSFKHKKIKEFFINWHFSRFSWPRLIFFSNLTNAHITSGEINALKIMSFGVADTNILSHTIQMPIPGNDDGLLCVVCTMI